MYCDNDWYQYNLGGDGFSSSGTQKYYCGVSLERINGYWYW